jgi:class 3 adenylate cyclase/pSer/pThr/pTyr-binding forkhead associated (FHA) protein
MEPEQSVTQIISLARMNPELLKSLERWRRNVTVMFTDIKGSTSYFEKHGDIAGLMMVHECNELLKDCVQKHNGKFIKTIGDAVMAIFETPADAVRSAIVMQEQILEVNRPKPEEDRVTIRIGLNYGQGIVKSNDVFGDVVNVASRVESVAQPEQIVVSDTVYEVVKQAGEFTITYLGRFALKGKEENRDLYDVAWKQSLQKVLNNAAHTVLLKSGRHQGLPVLKLQQLRQDGSVGAEQPLKPWGTTVGSKEADFLFPNDPKMAPTHARLSLSDAQVFVEDLSNGSGVYVRLMATYTLQDGDEVVSGGQRFRFRAQQHAMAAAAATGTKIVDMQSLLDQPVAELVGMNGSEEAHYPLIEESVTWGRSKGTYVFPDDRFMSRTHARIYQRGEDFFLEDMGSRNGTFIRVRGKTPVPFGATIRVGGQILQVSQ